VLLKKQDISGFSSIDVIIEESIPEPPTPPEPCPIVLPTVYPHITIFDAYHMLECNALTWNEDQECNPAIRPVPTSESGSFVDTDTFTFTPRKIIMKARLTDSEREMLQSILDAHSPVVIDAEAQGIYLNYYPVWLQRIRKIWMYRDDGSWLVEITFYGECNYE
jgi:hypothetical protein